MIIVEKLSELREALDMMQHSNRSVGFVPTMGALHEGHISLINRAKSENQVVISSIFVNPTQFNDLNDLVNYPRTPQSDAELLSKAGCDLLFFPQVNEMYPEEKLLEMDFGMLERVMEGMFRPGHFKGVATIVSRFFEIINPATAYFGEKDFQQLAVIKEMSRRIHPSVKVIGCPTLREENGLAKSSRNIHLTPDERSRSGVIYETLKWAAEEARNKSLEKVKSQALQMISNGTGFKVQYLEFVDADTLISIDKYESSRPERLCIAVLTSKTRLIDNVPV